MHALLGENGAGKSTLSNILTGLYRPDEGEIRLYGEPVELRSPRDALDAGICMVHQHFRLVPTFTVAENVLLGDHRDEGRTLLRPSAQHRAARRRARRAVRDRGRSARTRVAVVARRAAARRDPEGALPRGADPDPRRADRGAHAAGSRVALRDDADDGRGGADRDLHLAQAARGEGRRRSRDRAAGGQDGCDARHRPTRRRSSLAGADGRTRRRSRAAERSARRARAAGARARRSLGRGRPRAAMRCAA